MYPSYMPVDIVMMLSKNKYRIHYKKEQICDKFLDKPVFKDSYSDLDSNSNSACIELFKFW
jgi:hypothetical protein